MVGTLFNQSGDFDKSSVCRVEEQSKPIFLKENCPYLKHSFTIATYTLLKLELIGNIFGWKGA